MKIKKNKFICFEGMDGSGKSTLSISLSAQLQQKGYSVKYLRWLDGEDTLLKRMLRFLSNTSTKSTANNKNVHSIFNETMTDVNFKKKILSNFYVALILINYLWFGLFRIRIARLINRYDVFIIDRYYFDVVSSICREFGYSQSTMENMLYLFKKTLPEPDLFILIIIDAALAFERKPDEFSTVEKAKITEQWHNELFLLIEHHTNSPRIKLDNSQKFDHSKNELYSLISDFCHE